MAEKPIILRAIATDNLISRNNVRIPATGDTTFTIVSGGGTLQFGKYNLNVLGGYNLNLRGLSLTDGNLNL